MLVPWQPLGTSFTPSTQSTNLQVLSCERVQFSGNLSRQTIILSHCLLALHLGTNLLAAQVTQLVPVVRLKANCSGRNEGGEHVLVSDLVFYASHTLRRKREETETEEHEY